MADLKIKIILDVKISNIHATGVDLAIFLFDFFKFSHNIFGHELATFGDENSTCMNRVQGLKKRCGFWAKI